MTGGTVKKRKKRKQAEPAYYPMPRYVQRPSFAGYSYGDGLVKADRFRQRLLNEAEFLIAVQDPRGARLRDLALELPFASLERMSD